MCSYSIFKLCSKLLLISQVSSNLLSEHNNGSLVVDQVECQNSKTNSTCYPKLQHTIIIDEDGGGSLNRSGQSKSIQPERDVGDDKGEIFPHSLRSRTRQKRQFNANNPAPNPIEQFLLALARLRTGASRVGNFVKAVALASGSSGSRPNVPSAEEDPLPGLDALPSDEPSELFYNRNDYRNFLFRQNLG